MESTTDNDVSDVQSDEQFLYLQNVAQKIEDFLTTIQNLKPHRRDQYDPV
jgi:hypothetical protein